MGRRCLLLDITYQYIICFVFHDQIFKIFGPFSKMLFIEWPSLQEQKWKDGKQISELFDDRRIRTRVVDF